jgi:hypothetical protein
MSVNALTDYIQRLKEANDQCCLLNDMIDSYYDFQINTGIGPLYKELNFKNQSPRRARLKTFLMDELARAAQHRRLCAEEVKLWIEGT